MLDTICSSWYIPSRKLNTIFHVWLRPTFSSSTPVPPSRPGLPSPSWAPPVASHCQTLGSSLQSQHCPLPMSSRPLNTRRGNWRHYTRLNYECIRWRELISNLEVEFLRVHVVQSCPPQLTRKLSETSSPTFVLSTIIMPSGNPVFPCAARYLRRLRVMIGLLPRSSPGNSAP